MRTLMIFVTSRTLLTLPIQYADISVDSTFIDSIVQWNPQLPGRVPR